MTEYRNISIMSNEEIAAEYAVSRDRPPLPGGYGSTSRAGRAVYSRADVIRLDRHHARLELLRAVMIDRAQRGE